MNQQHATARPARLAAVVALVALAGTPGTPEIRVTGDPLPNVLFVTVDTLRADRLSGYGYERPTTPNIDKLMSAGVRFTSARTVEPLTGPALASMLTWFGL